MFIEWDVIIYSGMPKSERSKSGKRRKQNFFVFGYQHIRISDTVWNPNCLADEPFQEMPKSERRDFRHLLYLWYFRQARISDIYSTYIHSFNFKTLSALYKIISKNILWWRGGELVWIWSRDRKKFLLDIFLCILEKCLFSCALLGNRNLYENYTTTISRFKINQTEMCNSKTV